MNKELTKIEKWDYVKGIGELWMEIVLVFGNEPVLFVCKDKNDQRYLIMTYSEEEGIYVISPTSCEIIFTMITNIITLREAFTSGDDIYLTSLDGDNLDSKKYDSKLFMPELLPREGDTFDLRSKAIDDYSRKLFNEYKEMHSKVKRNEALKYSVLVAAILFMVLFGSLWGTQLFWSVNKQNGTKTEIIVEKPTQEQNDEEIIDDSNRTVELAGSAISIKINEVFKKMVVYAASIEYPNSGEQILTAVGISENETVATSIDGKQEYTASELIDQKVVLAYEEKGYQVFFQGQYNGKFHWDGECLTNSYKDGLLYAATIAVYDDGKRISYEQLVLDDNELNYTSRECNGDINIGDSEIYLKPNDLEQKADYEDPRSADFYSPADYRFYIDEAILLKRYHGYTSDGKFNDNTGDAYLISYDKDGYVKTLYCGGITNGMYNDTTGKAWYITRNPLKETKYEYFTGDFVNGRADKDNSNPDYITEARIEELTQGKPYEAYLNWDWEYVVE